MKSFTTAFIALQVALRVTAATVLILRPTARAQLSPAPPSTPLRVPQGRPER
ncbi:hypothetical protein [Arthrobacter crystallopoietes]|uniref:hypothetical protein n=1 Tax=Crystallibacter crystallopoietes TaxID=37928 RepID=UPI0014867B0F|nr:hypothetical protein [Arthrobacter crystallopoietes]QTG80477.1 hypothetical protein J5251_16830 [Arthrobacter crystallopoietes]